MAAKRILRYLKGTMREKLIFRKGVNVDILANSDADWAGNTDDRKSTSGFCIKLNSQSGVVCWKSKKQTTVATSTAEAEMTACVALVNEVIYVNGILKDLQVKVNSPIVLKIDNQACIAHSKQATHHSRTKHFAVKLHYVRDLVEKGLLRLEYTSTENQPADVLTKSLGKTKTGDYRNYLLGMWNDPEKEGV